MKIIDAHLHYGRGEYFDTVARAAGHENTEEALRRDCRAAGIVHGVIMGNLPVEELAPNYPDLFHYCVGIAGDGGQTEMSAARIERLLPALEQHVMDEAATKFRQVNFVMCHLGEPYFVDAIAVMEKNPNVTADLSGMLEGKIVDFDRFCAQKHFYIEQLRGWLAYLNAYDRLMFGTDWPLANFGDYVAFTKLLIPEEHWDAVFYENAVRIYHLRLT